MKYNRSRIFTRMWKYRKEENLNFSAALKKSWAAEKVIVNIEINDYEKMMNKFVWKYYKQYYYKIDRSILNSRAIEIFYETLNKYDHTLSKFSTLLYSELRRVGDLCRYEKRRELKNVQLKDNILYSNFYNIIDMKLSAEKKLTKLAYKVLLWMISNSDEKVNKTSMYKKFNNYSKKNLNDSWNNIKEFYIEFKAA